MTKKLLSFLCIGLAILLLDFWFDSSNQDKTIILYDDEVNSLIETWTAQVGRPPNNQDFQGIINQLVEEEILYREALKLNLDKDDIIIKRRLAQKIGFLKEVKDTRVAIFPLIVLKYEKNDYTCLWRIKRYRRYNCKNIRKKGRQGLCCISQRLKVCK